MSKYYTQIKLPTTLVDVERVKRAKARCNELKVRVSDACIDHLVSKFLIDPIDIKTITVNDIQEKCLEIYLDFVNNFLTVDRCSEHYGISVDTCLRFIAVGKEYNEMLADNKRNNKEN